MNCSLLPTGLVPSLVQIFLVFPRTTPFGIGGVGLGNLTPVFVLIFNTIGWSIPAYAWFRLAGSSLMLHHSLTGYSSKCASCHTLMH